MTQELIKSLLESRADIKEAWSSGVYTAESADGTVQLNSKALGQLESLEGVLFWIEEGVEDDES